MGGEPKPRHPAPPTPGGGLASNWGGGLGRRNCTPCPQFVVGDQAKGSATPRARQAPSMSLSGPLKESRSEDGPLSPSA